MKIATGQPEDHPTPLPLDASATPGVQRPTSITPAGDLAGGVRDLTGERLSLLAAGESAAAAAMSSGMQADSGRRTHYAETMSPLGASYGDDMALPVLPDNSVPPPPAYGYPFSGDEPVPA